MNFKININIDKKLKSIKINFLLLGILIIAAILRFYHLGFQNPWLDELTTLQLSDPTLPLSKTNELIATRDAFPEVYYYPLKLMCSFFGHNIYVLRFFSAIFGVLSIYTIYLLVKELINKKAGYIAAVLLTVNAFHVYHSQEARAYSLLIFFILFANLRLVKFLKEWSTRNAILLGLGVGLIPNAHPLGSLNVMIITVFLFFYFFIDKTKKEQIQLIKNYLITTLVTSIVIYPALSILFRVSNITAFWIPEPTFETIKQAFFELLGSSEIVLYIYVIGLILFFILIFVNKKTETNINKKYIVLLLSIWVIVNIGFIIAKSYLQVSMILNRYFIGSLSLFVIALAYVLSLIKNNKLTIGVVAIFSIFSIYYNIFKREYYKTVFKSEWSLVTDEIVKNNSQRNKIIGAYAYVMSGLLSSTNSRDLGWEIKPEDYVNKLRDEQMPLESFWFVDGNFRPFSLSPEDVAFLDKHFIIDHQIDKYDCWAKHYKLKSEINIDNSTEKSDNIDLNPKIYLTDFTNGNLDDKGNLVIFESGKITSKKINLSKGKYELKVHGNSLPIKPIDNVNAHIKVFLDKKKIGETFLSENPNNNVNTFKFDNQNVGVNEITIEFDNDVSKNGLDRNVIIFKIDLKKIGS
jgi:mannosyltransferase